MRTRFGYVMEEDIGVDEALHSRPEYAAACPYCHPPATLEAQKVATAAKFQTYPGDTLTVEQRMVMLQRQYQAQAERAYREQRRERGLPIEFQVDDIWPPK